MHISNYSDVSKYIYTVGLAVLVYNNYSCDSKN